MLIDILRCFVKNTQAVKVNAQSKRVSVHALALQNYSFIFIHCQRKVAAGNHIRIPTKNDPLIGLLHFTPVWKSDF